MTAKEAREKATSLENEKINKQLQEIYQEIKERVKEARLEAHYYKKVHSKVIEQLKHDGYALTEFDGDQREGYTLTIKW